MILRTKLEKPSPKAEERMAILLYVVVLFTMLVMMRSLILAQAYLKQLQSNPLRTKMLTSGTLSGAQEFLASWIAHDKNKNGHYFTSRVPKMAIYGAFVSAPLGHVLISILQKVFAGRTSLKAKILQILASNLVVSLDCPVVRKLRNWTSN